VDEGSIMLLATEAEVLLQAFGLSHMVERRWSEKHISIKDHDNLFYKSFGLSHTGEDDATTNK
jgi:hypothetical protein